MFRSPAHVYLRPSGYYCRIAVPEKLRDIVKKNQIRHPLRTHQLLVAKHRARYLSFRLTELFELLRNSSMKQFVNGDIGGLIQFWLGVALRGGDKARAEFATIGNSGAPEYFEKERQSSLDYELEARDTLASGNYRVVAVMARGLLEENGYEVLEDSPEFRALCHELAKARLAHAKAERLRVMGGFDGDLPALPSQSLAMANQAKTPPPFFESQFSLSEVFGKYEAEMVRAQAWREKTRSENRAKLETAIEVLGDVPVASIDKSVARTYKERLQRYPKNRHKDARYRDLTLQQIEALKPTGGLSTTTINNHLIKVASFFSWAVDQGYASANPFENLTIRKKGRAKDDVLPFDGRDLGLLFNSPLYRQRQWNQPWQFWLPLLGLFTGARIEELCQLEIADFKIVDGIHCFEITGEGEKRLKTKASKRIIPIHPELMRIGLWAYFESQRRVGHQRLFPTLTRASGKLSHYPSKWFGDFKRGLGFPNRTKAFHSFRHTVVSKLREARAQDHEIKLLLGHDTGSVTHDRYGGDEPKAFLQVVRLLDYPLNLDHIVWPRDGLRLNQD